MSELHATLSGIGVSAGVAVGPLVIVSPPPTAPSDGPRWSAGVLLRAVA